MSREAEPHEQWAFWLRLTGDKQAAATALAGHAIAQAINYHRLATTDALEGIGVSLLSVASAAAEVRK